jgi:hypothetical protein
MREINDRWFAVPTSTVERHRAFASAVSAGLAPRRLRENRMLLTLLVIAPQGAGKTRNIAFLRQAFECTDVLDDLEAVEWPETVEPGTLVLSQYMPTGVPASVLVMSLEHAVLLAVKLGARA